MKIHLSELSENERKILCSEKDAWAIQTVVEQDEQAHTRIKKDRTLAFSVSLRKLDDLVMANGRLETFVYCVCSRCAKDFPIEIHEAFSRMYSKDLVLAGVGFLNESDHKPKQKTFSRQYNSEENPHDSGHSSLGETSDPEVNFLTEDEIDLKEVLSESIQLNIPQRPLCKEDCAGLCANCGTDLNVGRCACKKIIKSSPFQPLEELRKKLEASKSADPSNPTSKTSKS